MPTISRQAYADMYGPTTGDRIVCGFRGLTHLPDLTDVTQGSL